MHIWFGFYEHAFRMLRGAYEESGLARRRGLVESPVPEVRLRCLCTSSATTAPGRGSRSTCPAAADRIAGRPTEPRQPPLGRVIARTTRLLATGLRAELGADGPRRGGTGPEPTDSDAGRTAASTLDRIAAEMDRMESPLALDGDDGTRRPMRGRERFAARLRLQPLCATRPSTRCSTGSSGHVSELQGRAPGAAGAPIGCVSGAACSSSSRPRSPGSSATTSCGVASATLDDEDLREWLGRHGASEETLARSPVLRGLYDLTFAYRDGDKRRPSLAAGKGLQSLLMMINYEGSFMWRMRAGMGDVVFAPLYLALRQRGVKFHFFSRVTRLRLMPGRPVVEAIELTREATVAAGAGGYEPIERIGDWWCWPAAPYRAQLTDLEPRGRDADPGRRLRRCRAGDPGRGAGRRSAASWPTPVRGSSRCSTAPRRCGPRPSSCG